MDIIDKMRMSEILWQHYTFAHDTLRKVAFQNPVGCVGILNSPDANIDEFLDEITVHI